MTLILGALDGEIDATVRGMQRDDVTSWNGFPIHRGRIGGKEVVVAKTGVGKSLAAMLCQHLVDTVQPARVLFTGLAGAIVGHLEVGDTLIARDCVFHDMDATTLGFKPGEIPYTPYHILRCDDRLVEIASSIVPESGSVHVGRILTGDQFIASAENRERLAAKFNGDAVEMEGASVGLVSTVNKVPFLLIRTVSDRADGTEGIDFSRFLRFASDNAWHYLRGILSAL